MIVNRDAVWADWLQARRVLYVANPHNQRIEVLDAETMERVTQWPCDRPGPLQLDASGSLWMLQSSGKGSPAQVVKFTVDGSIEPVRRGGKPIRKIGQRGGIYSGLTSCERVDDRNGIVRHAVVEILAKKGVHASVKTSRRQTKLEAYKLDGTRIDKWNYGRDNKRLVSADRFPVCLDQRHKANPCLCTDILGDWREEVIWRTRDSRELQIYPQPSLQNIVFVR